MGREGVLEKVGSGTDYVGSETGEVGSETDLDQGSHLDAVVFVAGLLLGCGGGFEANTLVLHHHHLSWILLQMMSLHLNLQWSLRLLNPVHFYFPAPLH